MRKDGSRIEVRLDLEKPIPQVAIDMISNMKKEKIKSKNQLILGWN